MKSLVAMPENANRIIGKQKETIELHMTPAASHCFYQIVNLADYPAAFKDEFDKKKNKGVNHIG